MPLWDGTIIKGVYNWVFKEYVGDVIEQNLAAQKDPRNGFSRTREGAAGRKIASIPAFVFRCWQKEFQGRGGTVGDADWKVFLRQKIDTHPQYRTVDKMLHVTPHAGNLIVK